MDNSECKRTKEQQALLVRELHHRVKITLATVQAIMGSTARSSATIEESKTALIGRIGSLAKTRVLLNDESHATTFADILHSELDAFDDGSGARVRLKGPSVEVPARLAVSLGMAIHELTSNAAQFGALSVCGGSLTVAWTVTIEATRRTLTIDRVERGSPPVAQADAAGLRLAPAGIRLARTDPGED